MAVPSRVSVLAAACALAALVGACDRQQSVTPSSAAAPTTTSPAAPTERAPAATPATTTTAAHGDVAGIAWHEAANDAQVDAAFAAARDEHKPVFMYWGAKWCPPCNHVKATLFNRQDFIERSRAFIPVYVDGDSPGAQKIGARFKVSGYPTMVLFNADGKEVTRLPGEVEPARYTEVLTLGMNASRPVGALLADALTHPAALAPSDWRLLAFYSWETDQQQLIGKDKLPSTMRALAAACPDSAPPEAAMRLRLKALAFADAKTPARVDPAMRTAVLALLADPAKTREQTDMVSGYASEIVRAMSAKGSADRKALVAAFDTALQRLATDTTLSRADRAQALIARVDLVRIDEPDESAAKPGAPRVKPHLPEALVAEVREHVARDDREITDGYERQAVITADAYLLERAGLGDESDALLKANLAKSHSPYYLMSELAVNAKKRGDKAEALRWYREAYDKSEGPATRLQWGASYILALVELAPNDEKAIEAAATQLWSEAATQPDAFYMRSGRSLQKVNEKLQAWNKNGAHHASMARMEAQLGELCSAPSRSDDERATCRKLLATPTKAATA